MISIGNYTAKLTANDPKRTVRAIEHYVPHLNVEKIIN